MLSHHDPSVELLDKGDFLGVCLFMGTRIVDMLDFGNGLLRVIGVKDVGMAFCKSIRADDLILFRHGCGL